MEFFLMFGVGNRFGICIQVFRFFIWGAYYFIVLIFGFYFRITFFFEKGRGFGVILNFMVNFKGELLVVIFFFSFNELRQ